MTRPPAPPIPLQADERSMLMAFLRYYRAALLDRAYGLDAEQLRTRLEPSPLTIGGLLCHMALVELVWFRHRLVDGGMPEPFAGLDFDTDADAEMTQALSLSADEMRGLFLTSCAETDELIASAESVDQLSALSNNDGEHWSLRWILVHMIEEYARHCGHADLIRESIDGDVCE
ncbi:MAG: DinB family protein [Acidimicrobiales bacterium]